MKITVQSSAIEPGKPIPRQYTGDGQDISPPLAWSDVPAGTKELALICDDPDAPTPEPWVHWVIYKIPPECKGLAQQISQSERVLSPADAVQGKNSWNTVGYRGPAPPKGHGVHHYHFKLYALDTPLDLGPGADKKTLVRAMTDRVLGEGEIVGTYQR
jgi:Raf kinase inhibitor-like YbhB/YbcL family protein